MNIALFRPRITEEAIAAVADVLRSGWLGLGPRTEEFENAFARYTGMSHCVGLNSCTSALHLALRLLDLEPGSEVVSSPITFVSSNHAILYERLTPVFADVQPETGNLDPTDVLRRITDRTRAIIVVHYGGYPADLSELYSLAKARSIPIIEDCAHACGATYEGRRIGSHGDLHAFSFHAVKNLPMGDGGALTLSSADHHARARRLRWLGIDRDTWSRTDTRKYDWDYDVTETGFKYHMNDVGAAIGLAQLAVLESDNARRTEIATAYRGLLADVPGLQLPPESPDRTSSYHLFPVRVENRPALLGKLRECGIGAGVHYRRNDEYPMYAKADLPHAGRFADCVLSLPIHVMLTDEEIEYVGRVIRDGW